MTTTASFIGASVDLDGVAGIFRAFAYVCIGVAACMIAYGLAWSLVHQRKVAASIDSRLGHLELGVNGIGDGEPPLIDKVRGIENRQHSVIHTLNRICDHLGIEPHDEH